MMDAPFKGLSLSYLAAMDVEKTGLALQAFVTAEELRPAVTRLYEQDYMLEDVSVVDGKEGFLVVWHFDLMGERKRIALRMLVPHDLPHVPSIADIFQGSEWHERESSDFFGILFEGNPNPVPLLLPDDMTDHPLIKEERQRQALAEIIPPGEIIRAREDFAFFPKPKEEQEGS